MRSSGNELERRVRCFEGEQIVKRQLRRGDGSKPLGEVKIVYDSNLSRDHEEEKKEVTQTSLLTYRRQSEQMKASTTTQSRSRHLVALL